MSRRAPVVLAIAFVAALFALGLPYWRVPYAQLSLPDTLIGLGLFVVFAAAGTARWFGVGVLPATAVVGAAAPAVVLVRVAVDTAADPTAHNLWPFEVVIAAGLGFVAALAGALLGRVFAKAAGLR